MNSVPSTVTFPEVLRSLAGLPERQQLTTLKIELFHAIERVREGHLREQTMQQEITRLRAEGLARSQEHNAFAAWLDAEFAHARRALERVQGEREQRLRALRVELLATQSQRDMLESVCRSLLLTLEQAAADEAQARDTSPDDAPSSAASA